jgi:hypothetical protein
MTTPLQKLNPEKTEIPPAPEQDIMLGDLTPEFIIWHRLSHTEEEHRQRYYNRIPHDYDDRFGIERVNKPQETLDATELNRWLSNAREFVAICGSEGSSSENGFVGICGTDFASSAGNISSGVMMKNADVFEKRASIPHAKKRFLVDCLIAAKPNLSNRELARAAGVSHTYIANRRRIVQSGNN